MFFSSEFKRYMRARGDVVTSDKIRLKNPLNIDESKQESRRDDTTYQTSVLDYVFPANIVVCSAAIGCEKDYSRENDDFTSGLEPE